MVLLLVPSPAFGQIDGIERPPINYKTTAPDNVIAALQKRIDAGQVKLPFVDDHGYLPALLKELNVPQSSQVLVFSKTSLQRERITPKTPRALYFNDDVYVGFCLRGDVLEVSAVGPETRHRVLHAGPGADTRREAAAFTRQTDNCLTCHASTATGRRAGAPRPLGVSPTGSGCRSSRPGRSAPTTPARSRSAGAGGTSPARTASRSTWATG